MGWGSWKMSTAGLSQLGLSSRQVDGTPGAQTGSRGVCEELKEWGLKSGTRGSRPKIELS